MANRDRRNQYSLSYQENYMERNRSTRGKHYSLAFQGGGAKGLAYVGAYQALREMKIRTKEKAKEYGEPHTIPIKSIMGSSAGGIIALAVSTGIPPSELEKICYQMNSIPKDDRF